MFLPTTGTLGPKRELQPPHPTVHNAPPPWRVSDDVTLLCSCRTCKCGAAAGGAATAAASSPVEGQTVASEGLGQGEKSRECLSGVESKLDAILSNDSRVLRRRHRLQQRVLVNGGNNKNRTTSDGDSVEDYNNYHNSDCRRVSCDCESCLSLELLRVEREILFMIEQQKQKQTTLATERAEVVVVVGSSVSAAAAEAVGGGVGRDAGGGGAGAGSAKWRYLYVAKNSPGPGVDAPCAVEDEFELGDCDLSPFAMVSGGGGVFVEMSSGSNSGAAEKKGTTTVEGQLNALLTSSGKESVVGGWRRSSGGGVNADEEESGRRSGKKHTNLIENQLLTLEEQFWRSRGAQSTAKEVPLELDEEGTALLADSSQQTTMSDSTPVKRPAIKVTLANSGNTVTVLEKGTGGGGADVDGQKINAASAASATTATNFGRMKRFEQFLKSLVGKKSTATVVSSSPNSLDPAGHVAFEQPALKVRSSVELKSHNGGRSSVPLDDDLEVPAAAAMLRHSFGSMSSLNSAVQQKFLNILPATASSTLSAAKRNLSVNNLSTIPESSGGQGAAGRRMAGQSHRMLNGRAVRGLKTVSCSNFENLHQETSRGQFRPAPPPLAEGVVMRRGGESCTARRLQMSKSANHLQSMMAGSLGGAGGALRPLNRFRNSLLESSVSQLNIQEESPQQCSRCSSILSLAAGTTGKVRCSDSSVGSSVERVDGGIVAVVEPPEAKKPQGVIVVTKTTGQAENPVQSCKLCLGEVSPQQMTGISQCRCTFCTDCMRAYIEFEILEGAYEISCPDAMCPAQGVVTMDEIAALTSTDLMTKHNRYRLNREVELDKNRTWCPRAGCDTVCLVDATGQPSSSSSGGGAGATTISVISPSTSTSSAAKNAPMIAYAVKCPTCEEEFCSACKKTWHPRMSCEENMKRLAADGNVGIPFDSDLIKCCPMCGVPIEKDEGCAQMMCKRCKHVFCWYCLASLDDDFLLRHYDKGPCKNKLGHSRASVVWHRAQVIGIFAGFGILLLVASPLLLLAAPCIVCCKCRICSEGGPKIEEEHEIDFDDDPLTLHR